MANRFTQQGLATRYHRCSGVCLEAFRSRRTSLHECLLTDTLAFFIYDTEFTCNLKTALHILQPKSKHTNPCVLMPNGGGERELVRGMRRDKPAVWKRNIGLKLFLEYLKDVNTKHPPLSGKKRQNKSLFLCMSRPENLERPKKTKTGTQASLEEQRNQTMRRQRQPINHDQVL